MQRATSGRTVQRKGAPKARALLEKATQLVTKDGSRQEQEKDESRFIEGRWKLALYGDAGEASGSFHRVAMPTHRDSQRRHETKDPRRAKEEGARRARGRLRRYCAANRLNRLGTLTYAGEGCHDPLAVREHLGAFFRSLRRQLGGQALPYAWATEWHPGGHGLHVHFAVGRYVRRSFITTAWPRGFVHIKLLGDLPVGFGAFEEARLAARYLAKYVGKDAGERLPRGLHSYEVAQGFQPRLEVITGRSAGEVVRHASDQMGAQPSHLWRSMGVADWYGPPAVWAAWR